MELRAVGVLEVGPVPLEERLGQRSPCGSDVQLRVAHVLTWKQLRPADARSPLVALAADGPGI